MPRKSRDFQRDGHSDYEHILVQLRRHVFLFEKAEYKREYMRRLRVSAAATGVSLHAFCFFNDHVHLVVHGKPEDISRMMRTVHAVFAKKYYHDYPEMTDIPLFRDRFRSESLDTEEKLLRTVRAIHQEPVRRGLSKTMEEYPWSSYRLFLLRHSGIIDGTLILDSLHFMGGFTEYMKKDLQEQGYAILEETPDKYGRKDAEAEVIFEKYLNGRSMSEFRKWDAEIKKEYVRMVRSKEDISIKQLCRITGLGRGVIQRL